uniref:G-protein coupled receptors family 3 profile domain-containing protein n=1 Tax=Xenopus tropicalis TaxID=8364 RepID=A0A7D9NMD5_XENTR
MQALLYAVDEINTDAELLPNITLGFQVLDTCNTLRRTAQGVLLMLSGGLGMTPNFHCYKGRLLAGVIGDSLCPMTYIFVTSLQISYFSTNPILSNRDLFPSFFRTIPSDDFQMRGLAELISYFGWSWLGILANDDDYGQSGLQMVKREIMKGGACVAFVENILTTTADKNAPHIVKVLRESTAKVVVVISSDSHFVFVVEELLRQNVGGNVWIASEAWATSDLLTKERFSRVLLGTIGFAIYHGQMPDFTKYFNSLNPSKDLHDPFIREIWEQTFSLCTMKETLENILPEEQRLSLNICFSLNSTLIPYFFIYQLFHYLKNVTFKTQDGRQIFFDAKGNPPAIYDIVNWRVSARGTLEQVAVGSYDLNRPDRTTFQVDTGEMIWIDNRTQVPLSNCSPSCSLGFRKVIVPGKPVCCHECARCPQGHVSNQTDAVECQPCSWDTWPNLQQDRCLPRTIEFLSYEEPLGYSLAAITIFSSIIPLVILGLFIQYKETPIVRANNYSLSCLLLLSLFLCFLCSLGFIGYPQPEKCLLRQVAFGMVFALCISCVLAKTITVVIAFNATKPGSRLRKWTGVKVPYCVIICCVFIQLCVCVLWLTLSSPFPEQDTRTKPGLIIVNCNEGSPPAFWCMLGYLGLLASISFIVAFLARRLPDSFNEAKLITFSMLAFLSVWVSFIPAYLSARGMYTVAMEVFAILSSSWALVGCIFVPKCYIVLLRPDMNSREHLMGKRKDQK